jgi:isohexenylglutaconyl-CoA hydratase
METHLVSRDYKELEMLTLPKTKLIELQLEDGILHLTLNRPDVRNALSAELVSEIIETFETLDPSRVRAVVLRGAGGNFCAGGDIKDMAAMIAAKSDAPLASEKNVEAIAEYNLLAGKLFHAVNNAAPAVVAVLEGAVMGGGMGLACAADITIALQSTRFGLPETSLGLLPAQVAPFIRRRVGESFARLLGVLGGQFDAKQAQSMGLVHYLAEDEGELQRRLQEVLTKIKACAPKALCGAKKLMFERAPEEDDPKRLGMLFASSMVGEEAREGTAAFVEKRKPSWNQ